MPLPGPLGRGVEQAQFRSDLSRAQTGEAVTVVVVGDAGVGKTSFWQWCVAVARASAVSTLTAAAASGRRPYATLADLLGDHAGQALAGVPTEFRPALSGLMTGSAPAGHAHPGARTRIAAGVAELAWLGALERLARDGPILVAVDDVSDADAESRRVIGLLTRRIEHRGILVLTTSRSEAERPEILSEGGRRLRLGPLPDSVLSSIVSVRLGVQLPRAAMSKVLRVARGNPLVALEIASALSRGDVVLGTFEPTRVSDMLDRAGSSRLARLSPAAREVVDVVALAGQITPTVIDLVCRTDCREPITEAIDAGVLEVVRGGIRITHPLLSTCASAALPPQRRRELHGALARYVPDQIERARHLAAATPVPDSRAAATLLSAAREALRRGGVDTAAELGEASLRLTPTGLRSREQRLLFASDAWFEAGDVARSVELVETELDASDSALDRIALAVRLARGAALQDGMPAAADILEKALANTRRRDRVTVRARVEQSMVLGQLDAAKAVPVAQAALDAAVRLGEDELIDDAVDHLETLHFLLTSTAPRTTALAPPARRLSHAQMASPPSPRVLRRSVGAALRLKAAGDLDSARPLLLSLRQDIEQEGGEGALPPVLFHLTELEIFAGNLDRASSILSDCRVVTSRAAQASMNLQVDYLEALLRSLRGNLRDAEELARPGLAAAAEAGDPRQQVRFARVLGDVALARGSWAEARAVLEPAAALARTRGFLEPGFLRVELGTVEALVACGALTGAAAFATDVARRSRWPWSSATSALARAVVLAAEHQAATAASTAAWATARFRACGHPSEHARALLFEVTIQRRLRRRSEALRLLHEAREVCSGHGIGLWEGRLHEEGERFGLTGSGALLTPTERRITDAAARGLNNKEIAAAVHISVKTVEANLTRAYAKLGVRSRTELASLLASK